MYLWLSRNLKIQEAVATSDEISKTLHAAARMLQVRLTTERLNSDKNEKSMLGMTMKLESKRL